MPQLTTSPPPRRRRFPWEVLLLIFEEADLSTLAILGRVSLDVLSATAPILYRDAEVNSLKSLELLFCERTETKSSSTSSRISPYLDLSQLRNLTLDFSPMLIPRSLLLSSSRLVGSETGTISLSHLRIVFSVFDRGILNPLRSSLLPRLNPVAVHYEARDSLPNTHPWFLLDSLELLQHWNRIQTVGLKGVVPYVVSGGDYQLAALPKPTPERRRVVRVHLGANPSSATPDDARFFVRNLINAEQVWCFHLYQPGAFVLVVRTEEERESAEKELEKWRDEPWRSNIVVELEA